MSELVCKCAEHGLTAHITPRKAVVAVGMIIIGLSAVYLLYRTLKRKRVLDDDDDVLPPPIRKKIETIQLKTKR